MPRKKQENKNEVTEITTSDLPQIDVMKIVPSPFETQARRRAHFKQADLEELAGSIFQIGLIQPVVLREAKENGLFELIAGERRWLAAKIAGLKTVPFLLRNVSDETAFEIQMKENLNRLEPDPLDEAYSFKFLIEQYHLSPADIAGKFGRTENLVLRRLKLNQLIPDAIKDLEAGILPLGHAEEVALFPPETQGEVLKTCIYKYNDKSYGAEPLDKCKKRINDNIVLNLSNAVFDKTATDLHPDGLACVNCEKRTGFTPTLFDAEITNNDHCLEKVCFKGKERAHFENLKENYLKETGAEKAVFVKNDGWVYSRDKERFGEGEYLEQHNHSENAECDSSRPAIAIDRDSLGKTVYVCTDENCAVHQSEDEEDKPSSWQLERKENEFRLKVTNAVREKIIRKSLESVNANSLSDNSSLIDSLIRRFLSYSSVYNSFKTYCNGWENCPKSFSDGDQVNKFFESLDESKRAKLLFLMTFGEECYSSWQLIPQDGIKKLALDWTELDYNELFAKTFHKLAPNEFKSLSQEYLDKIKIGEPAELPSFWWTADAQAASDDDDDDDDDDDGYWEDDDETEDEEDDE